MLARLWWKEVRVFGWLWVFIVVLAVFSQCVALQVGDESWRHGALTQLVLSWAALYAFAVSSAAFAGEREEQTLRWLDVLPVPRSLLWGGKASFAVLSTLIMALVLTVIAELGTTHRDPQSYGLNAILLGFFALLLESVAWGLFWSSLSKHVLIAATLAIVCVGSIAGMAVEGVFFNLQTLNRSAWLRLLLASILFAISCVVITRNLQPERVQLPAPSFSRRNRVERRQGRRHSANWSLIWATCRESLGVWCALALLGILGTLAGRWWVEKDPMLSMATIFATVTSLLAGVNVFHADNRSLTYRFYVQHGVSAARVWLVKTAVWMVVLGVFWLGFALCFGARGLVVFLPIPAAFASGLLCGQVIKNGISAAVVASGVFVALGVPTVSAQMLFLVPLCAIALPPLVLSAASYSWANEWMLRRSGAKPILHLMGALGLGFTGLFLAYLAYRVGSVPDIGPVSDGVVGGVIPAGADRTGIKLYEAAHRSALRHHHRNSDALPAGRAGQQWSKEVNTVLARGWNPEAKAIVEWWRENQETIALVRQAAAFSGVHFEPQGVTSVVGTRGPRVVDLRDVLLLLAMDARERESRNDLAGAWDDIRLAFRVAHQATEDGGLIRWMVAAEYENQALHMALAWVGDPRHTRQTLRAALDDLKTIPERLPIAEAIKTESALWDQAMSLPGGELKPLVIESFASPEWKPYQIDLCLWLLANRAERTRARRVGRINFADLLQNCDYDPWKRPGLERTSVFDGRQGLFSLRDAIIILFGSHEMGYYLQSTPLVRYSFYAYFSLTNPGDTNLTDRRALVQLLALRLWQTEHNGEAPDRLDALLSSDLRSLPLDPYSGRRFGYVRSTGQSVIPLGLPADAWRFNEDSTVPSTKGQWLLYSVGHDRKDNGGKDSETSMNWSSGGGDIIYPVPDGRAKSRDGAEPAPK